MRFCVEVGNAICPYCHIHCCGWIFILLGLNKILVTENLMEPDLLRKKSFVVLATGKEGILMRLLRYSMVEVELGGVFKGGVLGGEMAETAGSI